VAHIPPETLNSLWGNPPWLGTPDLLSQFVDVEVGHVTVADQ